MEEAREIRQPNLLETENGERNVFRGYPWTWPRRSLEANVNDANQSSHDSEADRGPMFESPSSKSLVTNGLAACNFPRSVSYNEFYSRASLPNSVFKVSSDFDSFIRCYDVVMWELKLPIWYRYHPETNMPSPCIK